MEKRILVPIDYSDVSEEVVVIADKWAQRSNAALHFLRVDMDYMQNGDIDQNVFRQQFKTYLEKFPITSRYQIHLSLGTPYLEILELAQELHPDLIIMAAHSHTTMGRLFLGSNTDYVLHHCNCSVYVHKQHATEFTNKIIVPIDYSDINKPVIEYADAWAQNIGAELFLIHVSPEPKYRGGEGYMGMGSVQAGYDLSINEIYVRDMESKYLEAQRKFEDYVAVLDIQSPYEKVLETGTPYVKIKELQEKLRAGLIVMASHSHSLLNRLFVGSNTDYLMHHLTCPMFIYKEKRR